MKWKCYFLQRRLVPYLEGGLPPRQAARLEKHLAKCPECESLFQRVRLGHQAGQQFGRLGPKAGHQPPEFRELWQNIGQALRRRGVGVQSRRTIFELLSTPLVVKVLIVLVLVQAVLFVVSYRTRVLRDKGEALGPSSIQEFRSFTPLRISEFPLNTKPQVVTEGYVRAVYFDEREKTLHIKLVEIQHRSEPFVICEVWNPGAMAIPPEGSWVRVYGTARYDSQPDRGWNEVNPVVNIDVLKR